MPWNWGVLKRRTIASPGKRGSTAVSVSPSLSTSDSARRLSQRIVGIVEQVFVPHQAPRRGQVGENAPVRYGMPVGGPLQAIGPLAKAIEDRGFDSVWTTETTSNPFIQAALASQATSRVRIGTAIALAFPRSPGITAMTAVDVEIGRASCRERV